MFLYFCLHLENVGGRFSLSQWMTISYIMLIAKRSLHLSFFELALWSFPLSKHLFHNESLRHRQTIHTHAQQQKIPILLIRRPLSLNKVVSEFCARCPEKILVSMERIVFHGFVDCGHFAKLPIGMCAFLPTRRVVNNMCSVLQALFDSVKGLLMKSFARQLLLQILFFYRFCWIGFTYVAYFVFL